MSQLGFIQFMVAPLAADYVKLYRGWIELATMLADNFAEWAKLVPAESGPDVSLRVDAVRKMLTPPTPVPLQIADDTGTLPALKDGPFNEETTDFEMELGDLALQMDSCRHSDDTDKTILVREVRR